MNNNVSGRSNNLKTVLVVVVILILGASIALTLFIFNQKTNTRQQAAASTTLSFNPSTVSVGIGQTAAADVTLDPGNNQVAFMKLVVSYDSSKFDKTTAKIIPVFIDPNSGAGVQGFIQVLQPFANDCNNGTTCLMSVTVSVGSNPTYVITKPLKVASISLKPIAQTDNSGTTVAIDPSTSVLSLAPTDQPNENVLQLSSLSPLTVTIGNGNITPTPPVCVTNQSSCSWDSVSDIVSYHYKVTDVNTGGIVQESDVDPSQTSIQFPSQAGKTYKCTVTATNACQATSTAGEAIKTCAMPSPTPTSCPTPGTVKNLRLICPNCPAQ